MEQIDYTSPEFWAKAPADATHFGPENDERFPAWYKCVDGEWMCFLVRGRQEWTDALDCEIKAPMIQRPRFAHEHGAQPAEKTTALHAQAQALEDAAARMAQGGDWDGKGLPPVGVECECCYTSPSEYYRVKIIAHDDEKAVFRWIDGPMQFKLGDGDHYTLGAFTNPHPTFRPIRTPEQIAAEEREKAIAAMQRIVSSGDPHYGRKVCEALYDAGCRLPADA